MVRDPRQLFASDDPELRRQALARARLGASGPDVDLLFDGLADSDWRVRKEAVSALRECELDATHLSRLVAMWLPGDDVGQRNAAVQALGAHGRAAVEAISRMLDKLDADGLKLAIEAFALTEHESAMPWLRQLRRHADANVRAAAIESVASIGHVAPEAAAVLLEEALDEPDPFLKLVTLDVIRRLGLAPSWERLRELLGDPVLSSTGLELAARLGEPLSAPHFVGELERVLAPAGSAEAHVVNEQEARAVRQLARFVETSQEASLAARGALSGLSPGARARLFELCGPRVEPSTSGDALMVLAAARATAVSTIALDRLEDEALAGAAHRAIDLLGSAMTEVLLQWLDDPNDRKRATAVHYLAAIAERDPASPVGAVLGNHADDSPRVMRAWVEAMVRLCDDDGLVRALGWFDRQVSPSVHRSATLAALSLGERNPARAAEFARGVAPGQARAEAVCWLLSATDGPLRSEREDVDFLVAAMSSTAVATRVAALSALARRTSSEVLERILFALNDETYEVQVAAIRALGRFRDSTGSAPGTRSLIDIASKNADSEVELLALRALGHTRDPVALDFLVARVTAAPALVAVAAVEALGSFEPRLFVDALIGALRHGDSEVVKAALQALSRVENLPEGAVLECLLHPVWDVRRLAADVLGSHPSARAREALARHLAAEGESVVREAIVRSLSHYEPPGSLRTIPPPDQRQPE